MKTNHPCTVRLSAGTALAMSIAIVAISCNPEQSTPATTAPQRAASPTTQPATQVTSGHWINDQKLRQVMADLRKQNPAWPAGLPQEPEAPAAAAMPNQFEEIADLAHGLAQAADRLPVVAEQITMGEADRAGFLAEARTLHAQAVELQAAANRRSIEQMQRQMDGINSTCISCHSRYRDFSGKLNATQARAD